MIFKKIPKPKVIAGSTAKIANYLTGADIEAEILSAVVRVENYLVNPKEQKKIVEKEPLVAEDIKKRVGQINMTNVGGVSTLEEAVEVIRITQEMYLRNGKENHSDQNYHLVMSFPYGERPKDEDLVVFENRIAKELGYEEHQRFSVQHIDTDYFHVHIVINKINPETLITHNPSHDYRIMNRVATEIEDEYGLIKTNHGKGRSKERLTIKELDKEKETFVTYIKKDLQLDKLQSGSLNIDTWEDLHEYLASFDVGIKKKGAGLVLYSLKNEAVTAKPSSIDRGLSLGKLNAYFKEEYKAPIRDSINSTKNKESEKNQRLKVTKDSNSYRKKYRSDVLNELYESYNVYRVTNNKAITGYHKYIKSLKDEAFSNFKQNKMFGGKRAYQELQMRLYEISVEQAVAKRPNKTLKFHEYLEEKLKDKDFTNNLKKDDKGIISDEIDKEKYRRSFYGYSVIEKDNGVKEFEPIKENEYGVIIYSNKNDLIRKDDKRGYYINDNISDVGITALVKALNNDSKINKISRINGSQKNLEKIFKYSIENKIEISLVDKNQLEIYENIQKRIAKNERQRNRFGRFTKRGRRAEQRIREQFINRYDIDGIGSSIGGGGRTINQPPFGEGDHKTERGRNISDIANINDRLLLLPSFPMDADRIEGAKAEGFEELLPVNEADSLGFKQPRPQGDRRVRGESLVSGDDGGVDLEKAKKKRGFRL